LWDIAEADDEWGLLPLVFVPRVLTPLENNPSPCRGI